MITKVYTNGVEKSSPTCPYEPKTADTLAWAIRQLGIWIRLNVRSHQAEYQQGRWLFGEYNEEGYYQTFGDEQEWRLTSWEPMTSGAKQYLRDEMQKQVNAKFGREGLEDALEALLFHKHIDPLKEYFESLPKPTGRNILPNALQRCMQVEPEYKELARWASQYMFLGVVWRTFEPGTKLDEIPVLAVGGGIGKSTFPAIAVPQHIPGLYGSGLDLSSTPQRMVESILGKAIVEISEMVGAKTGDMNRIKAFLSRLSDDGTRLAFKHTTEPLPRRCVMVGTADREQFLPYDPNLRRFVPVVLNKGDARRVRTYMAKNRDRLWAEAVELYHKGVPAHLPHKLKDLAEWSVREAVL